MKYSDKLKDPRWQKRRLEIMNLDGFTCRICYDKTKTLNVHHLIYINGNHPWEYDDKHLITLCEDCHAVQRIFDVHKAFAELSICATSIVPLIAVLKQIIPLYVNNDRSSEQAIFSFSYDCLDKFDLDRQAFSKDINHFITIACAETIH